MQVWQTILNIIIFILCLSVVVCIHEAGHLTVAKICNVYCYEFSIGFGPYLFKHKFKHRSKATKDKDGKEIPPVFDATTGKPIKVEGETTFAIRAVPLGGFVSMAGEDDASGEAGVIVPKERTLLGVNHFKQICIMLAGIAMNFILAFVLFLCDYSFCPQTFADNSTNKINVSETITIDSKAQNTLVYDAGLRTGDQITNIYQEYHLPNNTVLEFPSTANRTTLTAYININDGVDVNSATLDDLTNDSISYAVQDVIQRRYLTDTNGNTYLSTDGEFASFKNLTAAEDSYRNIYLTYVSASDNSTKSVTLKSPALKNTDTNGDYYYTFEKIGISNFTYEAMLSKGEAWGATGNTFGRLFVGIYDAVGSLFTPSGWKNVGGIISVYKMSASGVTSGSAGYFLLLWGYISLNLGCFNLLPFPGLDGWQTLIALLETISRKKFSSKFKNIANNVGLIILMVLAVLLIVKDIVV